MASSEGDVEQRTVLEDRRVLEGTVDEMYVLEATGFAENDF